MCLFLTLRPADRSSRLPGAGGLDRAGLVVQERTGGLIFSADGTCGCSLLTDHASWEAPYWDLRQDVRGMLADVLEQIGRKLQGEAILEALWAGESPQAEVRCTITELAVQIRANRLATQGRYRLSRWAAV